jgi:spermidine synthase
VAEKDSQLSLARISLLVFGSGFCALVYQMAWLRLLRLIFGASTPATAAVVAIFMGGIGAGSLILGPRADRQRSPLGFYSNLEFGIAVSAALSPLLIQLVRWLYIAAGGSQGLGLTLGTVMRIFLATLVLGVPTFLMGGTLPAITRAVERTEDQGRRLLGVLYGANTLGAVLGAVLTTFFTIEILGIRRSIWVACLVNLLVALWARNLARSQTQATQRSSLAHGKSDNGKPNAATSGDAASPPVPAALILGAAAIVGFAFFLMELVWYRMLAPLLGGSSYTFGLILAVALLGIGAGGLLYGAGSQHRRPSLLAFATTCSLEALFMIFPFALGDTLAVTALVLRDLGGLGFAGLMVSWSAVVSLVVLPAAIVAGYQFPLLVAILGSGRDRVGSEVGWTYAWNTAGAILGSLAGGFGLIPLLSATGAWRLVTVLLVLLALVTAWIGARGQAWRRLVTPVALGSVALLLSTAAGPTAFWRHSPIGAGRLKVEFADRNQLINAIHRKNRVVFWQAEGRESSIAMQSIDGASFLISGKVDGHTRGDASTQVMSGLIGAALHPDPKSSLVIGLGTGSSAGWLAEVPSMERVDVVELEPDIAEVARYSESVNRRVLDNPKVHLIIGDGREILLTTAREYDIVFSEPSNPYRAGIASLFTRDFYQAVTGRLTDDGIFIQWLQGYEVDGQIVRTALATLGSVFDAVEVWHTNPADLLLIASNRPIEHSPSRLARVLAQDPLHFAMSRIWGVEGIEGFYAGFIANDGLTRAILDEEQHWINTDDRPIIEFGFARSLGRKGQFKIEDLIRLARARGEHRPRGLTPDSVNWDLVEDLRSARAAAVANAIVIPDAKGEEEARIQARFRFVEGQLRESCIAWKGQSLQPTAPIDILLLAECTAEAGEDLAVPLIEKLRLDGRIVEADAVEARRLWRQGQHGAAMEPLVRSLTGYRIDPWPYPPTMQRLIELASEAVRARPELGAEVFAALTEPFALDQFAEIRRANLFEIALQSGSDELCLRAIEAFGTWIPWDEVFLPERLRCLEALNHPQASRARQDLETFRAIAPFPLAAGLQPDS